MLSSMRESKLAHRRNIRCQAGPLSKKLVEMLFSAIGGRDYDVL